MATRQLEKLYEYLMTSRFDFMGRGTHNIYEIYSAVKLHPHSLCDDEYMCGENCRSGHAAQPEWKHTVRSALSQLRKKKVIWHGNGHGLWVVKRGIALKPTPNAKRQKRAA